MIWIVGEYAERIDNARELLESFVESFTDESEEVQLQLLTAVVKLFLKKPEDAKDLVTIVLNLATDNSDNPDLRDRGYVYWRLLSSDPKQAEAVILAKKPELSENSYSLDPVVLDVLLNNLSTLSSVYHRPPEMFVFGAKATLTLKATNAKKEGSETDSESDSEEGGEGKDQSDSDSGEGSGSDSGDEANNKGLSLLCCNCASIFFIRWRRCKPGQGRRAGPLWRFVGCDSFAGSSVRPREQRPDRAAHVAGQRHSSALRVSSPGRRA